MPKYVRPTQREFNDMTLDDMIKWFNKEAERQNKQLTRLKISRKPEKGEKRIDVLREEYSDILSSDRLRYISPIKDESKNDLSRKDLLKMYNRLVGRKDVTKAGIEAQRAEKAMIEEYWNMDEMTGNHYEEYRKMTEYAQSARGYTYAALKMAHNLGLIDRIDGYNQYTQAKQNGEVVRLDTDTALRNLGRAIDEKLNRENNQRRLSGDILDFYNRYQEEGIGAFEKLAREDAPAWYKQYYGGK